MKDLLENIFLIIMTLVLILLAFSPAICFIILTLWIVGII